MGGRDACRALEEKLNRENPDGLIGMTDAMRHNKDLNERLGDAQGPSGKHPQTPLARHLGMETGKP